jgi:hypothetical protein
VKQKFRYKISTGRKADEISIIANPSQWAANPQGRISCPFSDTLMNTCEIRTEISWSCGGMTFGTVEARAFANAVLAVCDKVDTELKKLCDRRKRKMVTE